MVEQKHHWDAYEYPCLQNVSKKKLIRYLLFCSYYKKIKQIYKQRIKYNIVYIPKDFHTFSGIFLGVFSVVITLTIMSIKETLIKIMLN